MAKKSKGQKKSKAAKTAKKRPYFGRLKKESFRKDLKLVSFIPAIPR